MKTLIAVLLLSLSSLTIAQADMSAESNRNSYKSYGSEKPEGNRPQQAWGSASSQRSQDEHEAEERHRYNEEQEERNKRQYKRDE